MKPYFTIVPSLFFPRQAKFFRGFGAHFSSDRLKLNLKKTGFVYSPEEYVGMSIFSAIIYFFIITGVALLLAYVYEIAPMWIISIGLGALFAVVIFFFNLNLPTTISNRMVAGVEKNLIPAVRDIVVQLNSGIPLFEIIVNISNGNYGSISRIFGKAAKEISAGKSESGVLEKMAETNPSSYFRRVIWQVVNAMKTGAPTAKVLKTSLEMLYEEQLIQINRFSSSLGGLAMFYTLIAVIAPSLFLTIAIVVSMFFRMTSGQFILFFVVMLLAVLFLQVFFIGLIKVRRSSLI